MTTGNPSATEALNWKKSLLWLALAVTCFHAAYTSIHFSAAGLLIFGYALGLVRLAGQPNVRRAFYFGLTTGFLGYAPQLFFFFRIFNAAASVLWLVLAFWVGLFTAMVCACRRRWGAAKTAWLIPIVWTGLEYFRSELYYLKFSWLNIGYALPAPMIFWGNGVYGSGFLLFAFATVFFNWRLILDGLKKLSARQKILLGGSACLIVIFWFPLASGKNSQSSISLAGVQMEFPPENVIPKILNQALAKNPDASIFVLSEYTLDGAVPAALKNWCRANARFLVVGGKDFVTNEIYYNTVFIVGTNGDIVFKQAKGVPIQFFRDGLPAPEQKVWDSPWGKIGCCVCYDLSYTRVTDELVRQGARLLIVPTMDVEFWGRHEHELHSRIARARAAEYGLPVFRVASSGISQAVAGGGRVIAQTDVPGNGEMFSAQFRLPRRGSLPLDRRLAPVCTGATGVILVALLVSAWREKRQRLLSVRRR